MTTVYDRHYIDGRWVTSTGSDRLTLLDPASEAPVATVMLGSEADADAAAHAAETAFATFTATTRAQRLELLKSIGAAFQRHMPALIDAVQQSLGAPRVLCERLQVPAGLMQVQKWSQLLEDFEFNETRGQNLVVHQPVGPAVLITSWNWPINGPMGVILPALAAGCPVVWKPSEYAAASATLLAQVMHDAGVPAGVFNMVHGAGALVGRRLVVDPTMAMVSFTGSVATGQQIGATAAGLCKRMVLELGGKSAFIVLPGADLVSAVKACATGLLRNSGQSCNAPSRLLVPRAQLAQAEAVAAAVAQGIVVGSPADAATQMGPLGNGTHYEHVQHFIQQGVAEGARLVAGGPGRPVGLERGWYARPTVFSDVTPDAHVAQDEAFGPVLTILSYDSVEDAVRIANHSDFGLSAYVIGADRESALAVAPRLRAGMVHVNGAEMDLGMPFGGFKRSGLGRKFGPEGLHAYLETQSILLPG